MKIIDSVWFNHKGKVIGIVIIDNGFDVKAYIGCGKGYIQANDEQEIYKYGAKFPLEIAKMLVNKLDE